MLEESLPGGFNGPVVRVDLPQRRRALQPGLPCRQLCGSYGLDLVTPHEVVGRAEQRLTEAIRRIVSMRLDDETEGEPYRRGHHAIYGKDLEHLWRERDRLVG